jgi:hypothetical protein
MVHLLSTDKPLTRGLTCQAVVYFVSVRGCPAAARADLHTDPFSPTYPFWRRRSKRQSNAAPISRQDVGKGILHRLRERQHPTQRPGHFTVNPIKTSIGSEPGGWPHNEMRVYADRRRRVDPVVIWKVPTGCPEHISASRLIAVHQEAEELIPASVSQLSRFQVPVRRPGRWRHQSPE